MSFIASVLSGFAGLFANASSVACSWFWYDEPKCPKSLIK